LEQRSRTSCQRHTGYHRSPFLGQLQQTKKRTGRETTGLMYDMSQSSYRKIDWVRARRIPQSRKSSRSYSQHRCMPVITYCNHKPGTASSRLVTIDGGRPYAYNFVIEPPVERHPHKVCPMSTAARGRDIAVLLSVLDGEPNCDNIERNRQGNLNTQETRLTTKCQ